MQYAAVARRFSALGHMLPFADGMLCSAHLSILLMAARKLGEHDWQHAVELRLRLLYSMLYLYVFESCCF